MIPIDRAALVEVLEKAQAAIWDAHYGHGIATEYARAVDGEIRAALASLSGSQKEREGE